MTVRTPLALGRRRASFLRLRSPKQLGARTLRPLEAVVLAIDSAKRSGHATYVRGRLVHFGELDTRDPAARIAAIRFALDAAAAANLQAGIAIETPFGGNLSTLLSLNTHVAVWRATWTALGGSPAATIDVQAQEWRRQLFGRAQLPRQVIRRIESITAAQIETAHKTVSCDRLGDDAAAAICLGYVARSSATLLAALGCKLIAPSSDPAVLGLPRSRRP